MNEPHLPDLDQQAGFPWRTRTRSSWIRRTRGLCAFCREYLEPLAHFRREKVRDTIVFFGSARIVEDGTARALLPGRPANWRAGSRTGQRTQR